MPKKLDLTKVRQLSQLEAAAAKKKLVNKSVRESTNKTYDSTLNAFARTLAALRKTQEPVSALTVTKDELVAIYSSMEEQGLGNAVAIRSALKKSSIANGSPLHFLDDADVMAATKAVKKTAKSKVLPCGTLTPEQVEALKALLREEKEDELFYAVVVATEVRLRIGELQELYNGDATPDPETGINLVKLHMWKQGPVGEEGANPEPKMARASMEHVFAAIARRNFGAGNRMFSSGIDGRLRTNLPIWADKLEWSKEVRYTGPHVFRHAGTAMIDALRTKIADAVLSVVAQQTQGTMRQYARSVETRIAKRPRE